MEKKRFSMIPALAALATSFDLQHALALAALKNDLLDFKTRGKRRARAGGRMVRNYQKRI